MPQTLAGFANIPEERWRAFAERLYLQTPKGLQIRYDADLRQSFLKSFEGPPAELWPLFDACAGLPLALVRGANSDLLSPETAAEMRRRRPDMLFADVPDRAHVPFLDEPQALGLIRNCLEPFSYTHLEIVMELREGVKLDSVLSNSFGFGGTNATLVMSKYLG